MYLFFRLQDVKWFPKACRHKTVANSNLLKTQTVSACDHRSMWQGVHHYGYYG